MARRKSAAKQRMCVWIYLKECACLSLEELSGGMAVGILTLYRFHLFGQEYIPDIFGDV